MSPSYGYSMRDNYCLRLHKTSQCVIEDNNSHVQPFPNPQKSFINDQIIIFLAFLRFFFLISVYGICLRIEEISVGWACICLTIMRGWVYCGSFYPMIRSSAADKKKPLCPLLLLHYEKGRVQEDSIGYTWNTRILIFWLSHWWSSSTFRFYLYCGCWTRASITYSLR